MACRYFFTLVKHSRLIGQKIECQPKLIFVPGFARESQAQDGIHKPPFLFFETTPEVIVLLDAEIRNGAIEATGNTEGMRIGFGDQPVTGSLILIVVTQPVEITTCDRRPGVIAFRLDRQQIHDIRGKAQVSSAMGTATVFKVKQVGTSTAVEQLHWKASLAITGKSMLSSIGHPGQNAKNCR